MLRDYQIQIASEGLEILRRHHLLYLAMQVRTGKTLTALHTADLYGAKEVLFLTKKKAIASISKDYAALEPSFNLYTTNYEAVHKLNGMDFDFIILDEAHSLGQYPRKAEKVTMIAKLCAGKPIIFLSGSPTPESYSQIFHQLYCSSFSPFKEYSNFYQWAKDYVWVKQRRFSHGLVNDYSNANKQKIDAAIKPLFITYSQQEAGFTQMVQEYVLKVKMQPATYALASTLRARRVFVSAKSGKEVVADTEVKLMQKLHQIYSGSVITEDGELMCFDKSKAEYIANHFKGKKIAVFYKFRAELEMLRCAFKGQITESPEEFAMRQDLTFLSQIQSGREGINLSTADALVMFNIDFSHVSYIQARARLQTLSRQQACELYWIFSEDGIEEKIYERVQSKQDYQVSYFRKDFKIQKENKAA